MQSFHNDQTSVELPIATNMPTKQTLSLTSTDCKLRGVQTASLHRVSRDFTLVILGARRPLRRREEGKRGDSRLLF